jgi:hypothetical protein
MAEKLAFYARGFSTKREITEGFVRDLLLLLEFPIETLSKIEQELTRFRGFISDTSLDRIILGCLEPNNRDYATQVAKIVRFGEVFLPDHKGGLKVLVSHLENWQRSEHNRDPVILTTGNLEQLSGRLPLIIKEYPGRLRQLKANRLAEATGLRAESIDLICDFRPVLDDGRSKIEGLIPLTTLKVVASGVDQFPISFEAVLSAKDVQELLSKAESAVKKLNALGDFAARSELPIPAVDLTETVD